MKVYEQSIWMAFLTFIVISIILTIPFSIYQYRKHGYVNKWRVFIVFSFILYCLSAYYLVIWPVPSTRNVRALQAPGTVHVQLIPFEFIRDILATKVEATGLREVLEILLSKAMLQSFFNVLLLFPMGIYLRYLFKKGLRETIFICFLISLFFELTQLSGLYGIYNAPYRLFDIDDLFLNTLGGTVGYLVSKRLVNELPDYQELDEQVDLSLVRISSYRRLLAFMIDSIVIVVPTTIIFSFLNIVEADIVIAIVFGVILYFTNGRTVGLWATRLQIVSNGNKKLGFSPILSRNATIYLFYSFIPAAIGQFINLAKEPLVESIFQIAGLVYFLVYMLYFIFILLLHRKFIHEKWSGTSTVIYQKELNNE